MAYKANSLLKVFFCLLFWACPVSLPAVTPPIPAHPSQYVVDLAGVMDAGARARLNAMLRDLEAKTTAQVVVLTINSLEGEPIESFSHQTAVKWGIGKKGKDNGVLLTVAVKDRKYRIEVGYGLESVLPDSLVGSIGRKHLVPHFKKGDFAGGINAAATEIINKITGEPGGAVAPKSLGETAASKEGEGEDDRLVLIIVILSVILGPIILIWLISRWLKKRGKKTGGGYYWFGGSGGSDWSSGGGGSGFSGGGGDFGGGGASGDW
jgi:uncharacterized protein